MKSIDIELFGKKLKLSQRSIKDIIDASLFDSDKNKTEDKLFLNAFIIYSGLKVNIDKYKSVPFWNIVARIKKKKLEQIVSVQNILSSVSLSEMNELCTKIYELDFGKPDEGKKKVPGDLPTSES